MSKEVFLVYKTDTWHSYNSRDIIGVATRKEIAIRLVRKQAEKEGHPFRRNDEEDKWHMEFLNEKLQTQGYRGEGEFQIEAVDKNVLL